MSDTDPGSKPGYATGGTVDKRGSFRMTDEHQHHHGPTFYRSPADAFRGRRVHPVRLEGGDASSDSYCFPS